MSGSGWVCARAKWGQAAHKMPPDGGIIFLISRLGFVERAFRESTD
jgi:hypothetical protein